VRIAPDAMSNWALATCEIHTTTSTATIIPTIFFILSSPFLVIGLLPPDDLVIGSAICVSCDGACKTVYTLVNTHKKL
jgi:hypothetical protein